MAQASTRFVRASTQYLTKSSPSGLVTGNGSRTTFGWVRFTTLPTAGQNYFLTDYTDGAGRGFAPFVTNDSGTYKFALSDYVASNPTTITISTATWYFWAVTHDGTNTRLYWNGSLINTTARTLSMGTPTVLRVGIEANGTGNGTNGDLFGVGYTSDAKSQGQLDAIQLLSSSGINGTNISNLISAFCVVNNFNDVTGTNNMTATNSPTFVPDEPVQDSGIQFDAKSWRANTSTSGPQTWTHTCGSGSNRYLVVILNSEDTDSVTGVTYNGVSMTQLHKGNLTGTGIYQYIYGLANPASGANTVSVSFTGSNGMKYTAFSYTNVKQTGQPDAVAYNSGNTGSNPFNTSITVVENGSWLVAMQRSNLSPTGSTNVLLRQNMDADNLNFSAAGAFDSNGPISPGAINIVMSYSSNPVIGVVGVSLAPAPSSTFTPSPMMHHMAISGGLM